MLSEVKIGSKITTLLLIVVLLSVFAISLLSYHFGKRAVESRYWDNLKVLTNLKAAQLGTHFSQLEANLSLISKNKNVRASFSGSLQPLDVILEDSTANEDDLLNFLISYQNSYKYINIALVNTEGKVVLKSNSLKNEIIIGKSFENFTELITRIREEDKIIYSDLFRTQDKAVHLYAFYPVKNDQSLTLGYIAVEFDMAPIHHLLNDYTGLGETGEVLIGKLTGSTIQFLNAPRKKGVNVLSKIVVADETESSGIQKAVKGMTGFGLVPDQNEDKTFASWTFLPFCKWGLVVKIDEKEIEGDLDGLVIVFIFAGIFITLVSFAASLIFSKLLTNPLQKLKQTLVIVAKGELPEEVKKETNDEIGEMAVAVSGLVKTLKSTADFAYRIGEGNYDSAFQPISQNDILGNALIRMRDSIREADKKDAEQNWIVSGVAEIGRILREQNDFDLLGTNVIAFVCEKIGAVQGAFYVVEYGDEQGDIPSIEMKASYAYHKKKYLKSSFRFAEGLIGQAAVEKDFILRTEVPDNYTYVTSGLLGEQKPRCLLVVPTMSDDTVYGIMEFASLSVFTQTQLHFLQEISVLVARTIFNIKVNQRTVKLLQEARQMSEELQLQQEVLRQNAEIMEATQEELKRTNARLEEQILEVNRTQKRMQLLLENASEVITIYEKDGKVRYISPSVEPILGYGQEEMIGINDIIYVDEESKGHFASMFDKLLSDPDEKVTAQLLYYRKGGETVWLEATGTNLLNDPAIRGIVVNTRDITERRRAEKESRMRGQMQALSENSPDLIMRLNPQGKVFFVNPTIKTLTGFKPEQLINRDLNDVGLNTNVVEVLYRLLREVAQKSAKVSREIDFPAISGDRIMQVVSLPEMNESKTLESVLFVAHDITERKHNEIELRETNKKVSESINYAKRIQRAILPDSHSIQTKFPNSFIYYKPKDVVSGDFPWFVQKEEYVYIAVVDCTGHGVPGALISLVGYFLLNSITKSNNLDCGRVLDLLNDGVTKTLKQDVDSTTKDGMDIALCRINIKNNTLDYAGAHRPLYYLPANGELKQVKGDKFPVGGGVLHYKDRTNFKNHQISLNPGDSIYFFSDGLPDQFGGIENRKYSPKQVRDVIEQNRYCDMSAMHRCIADSWETWKGNNRQTDDILMIGIKF
jgi:PAS domain S-box-containing protein